MQYYLFDLDGTLIDHKIYVQIYEPVLSMIKKKLHLAGDHLDIRAEQLGLEKNQSGRWDTGELCKKLKLLDEYYLIFEKNIEVNSTLHLQIIALFQKLRLQHKHIAIVSNAMQRT